MFFSLSIEEAARRSDFSTDGKQLETKYSSGGATEMNSPSKFRNMIFSYYIISIVYIRLFEYISEHIYVNLHIYIHPYLIYMYTYYICACMKSRELHTHTV